MHGEVVPSTEVTGFSESLPKEVVDLALVQTYFAARLGTIHVG